VTHLRTQPHTHLCTCAHLFGHSLWLLLLLLAHLMNLDLIVVIVSAAVRSPCIVLATGKEKTQETHKRRKAEGGAVPYIKYESY